MKAYAIKTPQGDIINAWIRRYANEAKAVFIDDMTVVRKITWKELYKQGYRCVRVEILETKNH